MEAWILCLWSTTADTPRTCFEMQNRDSCGRVAITLTRNYSASGFCANQFDGSVIFYTRGRVDDETIFMKPPFYPKR